MKGDVKNLFRSKIVKLSVKELIDSSYLIVQFRGGKVSFGHPILDSNGYGFHLEFLNFKNSLYYAIDKNVIVVKRKSLFFRKRRFKIVRNGRFCIDLVKI